MTDTALPPLVVEETPASPTERLLRWVLVIALHGVVAYVLLLASVRSEVISLPPNISVRLLPMQEEKPPAPPTPKPPPPTPSPKAAPVRPMPVLASKAEESSSSFAVAPQPPAPVQAPPMTAPPAPPAPLPVVAARFDADYLHNPKPVYPALSRRNGETGKVLLRVRVSGQGSALELEVKQSSGFARLDAAARDAVSQWRFVPARRGDEAIESWVVVPITFALD